MVQIALLVKPPMAHEEGHFLALAAVHHFDVLVHRRTGERPLRESQTNQVIGFQIGGGGFDGDSPVGKERAWEPSPIAARGSWFDRAEGYLRTGKRSMSFIKNAMGSPLNRDCS